MQGVCTVSHPNPCAIPTQPFRNTNPPLTTASRSRVVIHAWASAVRQMLATFLARAATASALPGPTDPTAPHAMRKALSATLHVSMGSASRMLPPLRLPLICVRCSLHASILLVSTVVLPVSTGVLPVSVVACHLAYAFACLLAGAGVSCRTDACHAPSRCANGQCFAGSSLDGKNRCWQQVLATGVGNRCWQQVLATGAWAVSWRLASLADLPAPRWHVVR